MRGIVPDEVVERIQNYLRSQCRSAQGGFNQLSMDEDSVTGALGERLRTTRTQGRKTQIGGHVWRWRISFQKLRGEGPHAAEHSVGADGLFQIEVEDMESGKIWRKGLLFQGKMEKDTDRKRLVSQMNLMEEITPHESLVVEYGKKGYVAIPSAKLLEENKSLKTIERDALVPLGDVLADQFVECTIGVRGMYYDAHRRVILVPSKDVIHARRYSIEHRISIDISHGIE